MEIREWRAPNSLGQPAEGREKQNTAPTVNYYDRKNVANLEQSNLIILFMFCVANLISKLLHHSILQMMTYNY